MSQIIDWVGGRYLRLQGMLKKEDGLETLEVVAMMAVGALAIGAIMIAAKSLAPDIGEAIFGGILKWATTIGGG